MKCKLMEEMLFGWNIMRKNGPKRSNIKTGLRSHSNLAKGKRL